MKLIKKFFEDKFVNFENQKENLIKESKIKKHKINELTYLIEEIQNDNLLLEKEKLKVDNKLKILLNKDEQNENNISMLNQRIKSFQIELNHSKLKIID